MTIAIKCTECGNEVVFWLDGGDDGWVQGFPTETCNECGTKYELRVRKVEP